MVHFMLQRSTVQPRILATAAGWELSKAQLRPVVERWREAARTRTADLRHDGYDEENGDRKDQHDERPGCS